MGNNQSNHFPHIPEKVTWSLNTIINGKSQTLLSDFFFRGGAAVHRLPIVGITVFRIFSKGAVT